MFINNSQEIIMEYIKFTINVSNVLPLVVYSSMEFKNVLSISDGFLFACTKEGCIICC